MAATKAKPGPRCGPYSVPVWDADARKWDRRLTDAGRDLVAAYLAKHPFPVSLVAHAFPHLLAACRRLGIGDDEINQVGRIAVMKAVSLYDPARKIALTTYVAWWVRGRVSDLLPTRRAAPRLRQHQFGQEREYGEFPPDGPIRACGEFPPDGPIRACDVPDHRAVAAAGSADLRRELAVLLRHLPRNERLAVVARANGYRLKDVAAALGVSGKRVQQLERNGLERLRRAAGVGG